MRNLRTLHTRRVWRSAAACTIVATACGLVQGCGGGADAPDQAALASWPAAAPTPALLADDGSVMPTLPQAEPADPGLCAQARACATRDQAEQLDSALGGRVVWVDAGCCGDAGVQAAVASAMLLQASLGLDNSAPVFVTGAWAASAAATTDHLRAAGLSRVWWVTR